MDYYYYLTIIIFLIGSISLLFNRTKVLGIFFVGIGIAFFITIRVYTSIDDFIIAYNAYQFYLPELHAMHWLKKFVQRFFHPAQILIYFMIIGFLLILFKRVYFLGRIIILCTVIFYILFGYAWFGRLLMYPLTNSYPVFKNTVKPEKYIAVLSGLGDEYRMREGIRICKENKGSKLILDATKVDGVLKSSNAEIALNNGISSESIMLNVGATNTKSEIDGIKKLIGNQSFVLVTEAFHMGRAIVLARGIGLNPIPASVKNTEQNYLIDKNFKWFPSLENYIIVKVALHEYAGIIYTYFRY